MIGRIVRSTDFERVLGAPIQARSQHFAVHYLCAEPSRGRAATIAAGAAKLSTGQAPERGTPVDESPDRCYLGAVIPKRHARRSVTRNLLKRQIRAAAQAQSGLHAGLWIVRLRSPFDPARYESASSDALRLAAARELGGLMAEAARRTAARP